MRALNVITILVYFVASLKLMRALNVITILVYFTLNALVFEIHHYQVLTPDLNWSFALRYTVKEKLKESCSCFKKLYVEFKLDACKNIERQADRIQYDKKSLAYYKTRHNEI